MDQPLSSVSGQFLFTDDVMDKIKYKYLIILDKMNRADIYIYGAI